VGENKDDMNTLISLNNDVGMGVVDRRGEWLAIPLAWPTESLVVKVNDTRFQSMDTSQMKEYVELIKTKNILDGKKC
jgi:hypothetical protein